MNGMNLNAFQFDFDLTWMAFFQNSEGQTYARYGGREDSGPETHMTKQSLVSTMQQVLKLHQQDSVKPWSEYDPQPVDVFTPEQIPPMKSMLAKREETCIHCHDVKNATLHDLANQDQLKKDLVYGYPSPARLGLQIDSEDQTVVREVVPGSVAASAGVNTGDIIQTVNGQRVLTFADFTRVLELAPESGTVSATVKRNGGLKTFSLKLQPGWRTSPDPSWRPSTGAVGPNSGFWANQLNANELRKHHLSKDVLGLKVVVVWGPFAKKAGVRNGDIVVEFDGMNSPMGIRQLQTHLQMNRNFGESVKLKVLRGGRPRELTIVLPKQSELH